MKSREICHLFSQLVLFLSKSFFCFHLIVFGLLLFALLRLMSIRRWWATGKVVIKNIVYIVIKLASQLAHKQCEDIAKGNERWKWNNKILMNVQINRLSSEKEPLLRYSRERVKILIFQFIEHKLFYWFSAQSKVSKVYLIFTISSLFCFSFIIMLWKFPVRAQSLQKPEKLLWLLMKTRKWKGFLKLLKTLFMIFLHFLAFEWNENFVSSDFWFLTEKALSFKYSLCNSRKQT